MSTQTDHLRPMHSVMEVAGGGKLALVAMVTVTQTFSTLHMKGKMTVESAMALKTATLHYWHSGIAVLAQSHMDTGCGRRQLSRPTKNTLTLPTICTSLLLDLKSQVHFRCGWK